MEMLKIQAYIQFLLTLNMGMTIYWSNWSLIDKIIPKLNILRVIFQS